MECRDIVLLVCEVTTGGKKGGSEVAVEIRNPYVGLLGARS